jgi:rubrerythrin
MMSSWAPFWYARCADYDYPLEGEAPDKCPVCNAKKEKFAAYS